MSEEIWKPVVGEFITDIYDVSNKGGVRRSLNAPKCNASHPGRVLNPDNHNSGYRRVTLRANKKVHRLFVHRLVARAFLGEARKFAQVNHIDGDKHNNCVENLEWCTSQENVAHAWSTGLSTANKGEKHGCSKLQDRDILVIRNARSRGVSLKSIAYVFNVAEATISSIDRCKTWKHVKPITEKEQEIEL